MTQEKRSPITRREKPSMLSNHGNVASPMEGILRLASPANADVPVATTAARSNNSRLISFIERGVKLRIRTQSANIIYDVGGVVNTLFCKSAIKCYNTIGYRKSRVEGTIQNLTVGGVLRVLYQCNVSRFAHSLTLLLQCRE